MSDQVLDLVNGGTFVQRAADPVISNAGLPADFAAQYPTPLDTTEIITMCEEVTVLQAIPELSTGLKQETWREMSSLAYVSGSSYIAFADYACPEEYSHDGTNKTIDLKNIGAKKSLGISDIMHSAAVAAAGAGINRLVGPSASSSGMPGGANEGTFLQAVVADVKEKEVRLGMTLVLNGWDRLLVKGNASSNALEFDGIENWAANQSVTFHTNNATASGTFAAAGFDQFLSEACAKPTHVFGHPQAIQEMLSSYFQLGYAGSQVVNFQSGSRITPGFNFAGVVNTGVGALTVVADTNFTKTAAGANLFRSNLYTLRMTHNGEPMVYRRTQIPLSIKDLVPGCTAISFELWAKTALIIKGGCMQGAYTGFFTGRVVSTCAVIG